MIEIILENKWKIITAIFIGWLIYYLSNTFQMDEFDFEQGKVKRQIIAEVGTTLGLSYMGGGGSSPDKELHYFSFRFLSHEKTDISSARKQLLTIAEIYLKYINSNEILKKYMVKYPFDIENCDISIFYQDQAGKSYLHPNLYIAAIYNGPFLYYTLEYDKYPYDYKTKTRETYEEALTNSKDPALKEHDK